MKRILVVDDDRGFNAMIRMHLEEAGYRVNAAGNCREAFYLLECFPFNLVLLDYKLPDGTGFDVLRELARRHPALVVVMMSSDHDDALRRTARRNGALDLLPKPLSLTCLQEALARALAA